MVARMAETTILFYIFFLTILEVVVKTKIAAQGNSHAFIQANNEVRYLVDGIAVPMHKELAGASGVRVTSFEENSIYSAKTNLKFEPPLLDFKERYLGMPHHEKVTLFNINSNKTIHMSSISGNTVHFHSSFFEDKIIPPLGNTTFNVVFLGREEGEIESNLFIHTSEGSFKYRVKGASISSPYRLRPLVGVRVPLNSTYSPLICLHNPHAAEMQITEVYSSGGDFHLELPSGELEGPKHLWEIPPFHTKPVIRVRFLARAEKNHTAYIRVKVNRSDEVLVVPLEVEVGSHPGLYSPEEVVDFGIGGSYDKPRQVKLLLYNSWKKVIKIQNIISTPVSKALKIDFQPIKVPPDPKTPTQVAVLTLDWRSAFESKHFYGKLVIKSKQSQHKLVIPYMAQVLEGGLEYNASVTQYCADPSDSLAVRDFTVTNRFHIPVALVNATLSQAAQAHFMIHNMKPVVLKPGETAVFFQLSIKKATIMSDLKLESYLLLYTNVSVVSVPVLCYNGRLIKVMLSNVDESELNLGTVGSGSTKEVYFALLNNNPVAVPLRNWGTNLTEGVVVLVGIDEGNVSSIVDRQSFTNLRPGMVLQPGQYAVFRVLATASRTEEEVIAEVFVMTQFERVVLPTRMRVAHGSLEIVPESLVLDDCFPGKRCVKQLHVRSLFSRSMVVTRVTSVPPDPRVTYSYRGSNSDYPVPHISPQATSTIGELTFEPSLSCRELCYLGIPTNSTVGSQWLHTLGLPIHAQDSDYTLLSSQYHRYLAVTGWQNVTVRLDTNEVRAHLFSASVRLTWPRLSSSGVLAFPLTQIGNTSFWDLRLFNPSNKPLVVQLVLDWVYPQGRTMFDRLPKNFRPNCVDCSDSLPEEFTWTGSSEAAADVESRLGVAAHRESYPLLMGPGEVMHARLGYSPQRPGLSSALLYIRNNLTVLELVRVMGQSAHAQFKFGNRKPGSGTPLLFELAEKHLKDCEREKHRRFPAPNLTVKRSFTARNTGELPIHVNGFSINGFPCEGFGFRILNCAAFVLPPNGTRKIDIAFTPDFTLARIQRTLTIDTSLGVVVNYTLITTLPPYFLASCSSVLSRPNWEPLLYYSAISFMAFIFFCVMAAAFLESDRILKCALMAMARDHAARAPFDLKQTSIGLNGKISSESKTCKMDGGGDWGLSPQTPQEKHSTKQAQANGQTNGSNRNSIWSAEERRLLAEIEMKDRLNSTKYEEPEGSLSNNSTPHLSLKNKRKLSKKSSNNSDASSMSESFQEVLPLKKDWSTVFSRSNLTHDRKSNKTAEPDNKTVPSKGNTHDSETGASKKIETADAKKSQKCKKNKNAQETVPCSEEETSSTTTESSNNEEVEKERDIQSANLPDRGNKPTQKKIKSKASDYKDNYEGDCDDDDYERDGNKKKDFAGRWKSSSKSSTSKNTQETIQKTICNIEAPRPQSLELPYKLKSTKNTNRDRKEKNVLKKRTIDKSENSKGPASPADAVSMAPAVRVSPPLRPGMCWGEHRATFSDVVARNESPLYSNVVAPRQPPLGAPRKVSEPVTVGSVGLGPIGSKKPPSVTWESYCESSSAQFPPHPEQPSSLFMDSFSDTAAKPQQAEVVHMPAADPLWEQRRSVESSGKEVPRQELFRGAENWPASLWDPLYTPAVGDAALYTPPASEESAQLTDTMWCSRANTVWSSPLWSSVPGPAPPTVPPTIAGPIMPPGVLPPPPQRNMDEEGADMDRGLGFDPFRSLNNIWSPRSGDPWSPPNNE